MESIAVVIPIRAVPQPRHRATRGGRVYLPASAPVRRFKADVVRATRERIGRPLPGAVAVTLEATFARPRSHRTASGALRTTAPAWPGRNLGDVDNLAKAVLDALNGVAWADDVQVVRLNVGKRFGESDSVSLTIAACGG